MGHDKANGLITSIGVSAMLAAPAGFNVSLDSIVSQALSRLTREELSSVARGDATALTRAQGYAVEQVKAQQQAQPAQKMYAAGQPGADGKNGFAAARTAAAN
jgi:hypothetical protein